jgi:hypothetical protein
MTNFPYSDIEWRKQIWEMLRQLMNAQWPARPPLVYPGPGAPCPDKTPSREQYEKGPAEPAPSQSPDTPGKELLERAKEFTRQSTGYEPDDDDPNTLMIAAEFAKVHKDALEEAAKHFDNDNPASANAWIARVIRAFASQPGSSGKAKEHSDGK